MSGSEDIVGRLLRISATWRATSPDAITIREAADLIDRLTTERRSPYYDDMEKLEAENVRLSEQVETEHEAWRTQQAQADEFRQQVEKQGKVLREFVDMYDHDDESWMTPCTHVQPIKEAERSMGDIYNDARAALNGLG